jgi:hypothetical protein
VPIRRLQNAFRLRRPHRRLEDRRRSYVAQVDFVLRDHVPNEFVRVNPLRLQVSYFRVDQAFEEQAQPVRYGFETGCSSALQPQSREIT